jgi:hypothetical protein
MLPTTSCEIELLSKKLLLEIGDIEALLLKLFEMGELRLLLL